MCNYNSVKTSLIFFIFFDHSSSFKQIPFEMNNKKNIKSNRCNIFFLFLALLCFAFLSFCIAALNYFFSFLLLLFVLSIHSASIYFIFVTQTAYRIVHICTTNAIISEIHCIFCISFIIFLCVFKI